MRVRYAVRSKVGSKRENNEDAYRIDIFDGPAVTQSDCLMLFAVADGIGGHPCGEVASMIACDALADFFMTQEKNQKRYYQNALEKSFFAIDEQIRLSTRDNPNCCHMGTTLSVIIVLGEKAAIVHVGDTRIYNLRGGVLRLLTTDHTFIQDMLESGVFTAEMADASPHQNILTQVLGTDEPLEDIYTRAMTILDGDRILLSSDGLHDVVSFHDIELIIKSHNDPEKAADLLLSQAMMNGGRDDITLIVADIIRAE